MKFVYLILFTLLFMSSPVSAQKRPLDSLFNLALEFSKAGDVPNSTSHYLAAQKLAEAENDLKLLCRIQLGLGKLGLISENNTAVSEALVKAEKYCAACKDTVGLARGLMQKGIL